MMMELTETIRCYMDGRIEIFNKRVKPNRWTEVKQTSFDKDGYLKFCNQGVTYKWHRAIWEAFNGKIPYDMEINHKDEDKTNNSLDNLELVFHKDNCNYGTRNDRVRMKQGYKILCLQNGKYYESIRQASSDTGVSRYFINRILNEEINNYNGLVFIELH